MILTTPTILTLLRIAAIPVFMLVFFLPFSWSGIASAVIFTIAAVTDWLDGYLARKLGQTSRFGAFLDPVADKLMVAAALVLLVQADPTALLAIPAIIIIGREIAISALREWMAEIGERASVAVSFIAKVKTTVQMMSLVLLLIHENIAGIPVYSIGIVLLYIAAGLTLWSMFLYLKAAWPSFSSKTE